MFPAARIADPITHDMWCRAENGPPLVPPTAGPVIEGCRLRM
jgi:hypothetical protein